MTAPKPSPHPPPPRDLSDTAAAALRKLIGGNSVPDKRNYGRRPLPKRKGGHK